jgi:hypothetical protein
MPTATTANALSTLAVDNEGYLQAGCLLWKTAQMLRKIAQNVAQPIVCQIHCQYTYIPFLEKRSPEIYNTSVIKVPQFEIIQNSPIWDNSSILQSILKKPILAENFSDKFSSSNFGQISPKKIYVKIEPSTLDNT